jgi:hypothetical protein
MSLYSIEILETKFTPSLICSSYSRPHWSNGASWHHLLVWERGGAGQKESVVTKSSSRRTRNLSSNFVYDNYVYALLLSTLPSLSYKKLTFPLFSNKLFSNKMLRKGKVKINTADKHYYLKAFTVHEILNIVLLLSCLVCCPDKNKI